tara:strand:+ start:3727 stop:3963 length:237 start_codon:yes stop_codon:yes gene_type:complete
VGNNKIILEEHKMSNKDIEQLKKNAIFEFFNDYLDMIEIGDDMVLKEMWHNVHLIEQCKTEDELNNIKFVEKETNWRS